MKGEWGTKFCSAVYIYRRHVSFYVLFLVKMEANNGGTKRKAHSSTDQFENELGNKLSAVMLGGVSIPKTPKKKKQKRIDIKIGNARRELFKPLPPKIIMTIVREKSRTYYGEYQGIDWRQVRVIPGTKLGNGWRIGNTCIGAGGNGIVLSAINDSEETDNKSEYVVKITTEYVGIDEATMLYNVSRTNIPGIPRLIQKGPFCRGDRGENFHYFIMTKPIKCMNLRQYSKEEKNLIHVRVIFRDLTDIVKKLIQNGFAQTDLTPTNVIIDSETLQVYMIDFGSFCKVDDFKQEFLGTYQYRPPEILQPSECDRHFDVIKATVWMLGCILYELLFNRHNRMQSYLSRANQGILPGQNCENYKNFHFSPEIEEEVNKLPDYVTHVLKGCLCVDHTKRMTLDDILKTKWLRQGTIASELMDSKIN